jgi:hypothetical protein
LTIKFTQEQQTSPKKTFSLFIDACTVKLALCVSYFSDIAISLAQALTSNRNEANTEAAGIAVSDNSHYSIVKDLFFNFDRESKTSTLRISVQPLITLPTYLSAQVSI